MKLLVETIRDAGPYESRQYLRITVFFTIQIEYPQNLKFPVVVYFLHQLLEILAVDRSARTVHQFSEELEGVAVVGLSELLQDVKHVK